MDFRYKLTLLQWIFESSLRKLMLIPEKLVCRQNPCKSQEIYKKNERIR